MQPDDTVASGVSAAHFLLGPDEFVAACAEELAVPESLCSQRDRRVLADAIRAGRPRFDIVETLRRLGADAADAAAGPSARSFAAPWDDAVVVDLLERYAPDDDEDFVRQAYGQILARRPSPLEVLETGFDLKGGTLTRRALIERLARRSDTVRLSPELPPETTPEGVTPGGDCVDADGRAGFILMKFTPTLGWVIAPDVRLHSKVAHDGALYIETGRVLNGPRRSLPPGPWSLAVDLLQDEAATLVVEVVANAGLDVLLRAPLLGPARFRQRFTIEKWHHFIDVRVIKPAEADGLKWLKIRELSLTAVS